MSTFELDGGATAVDLAPGWALRAPGVQGKGEFDEATAGSRRALNRVSLGRLDEALAALDMSERGVAQLPIAAAGAAAPDARRRGDVASAEVEIDVPPPPEGCEQVVLSANVDGTVTWHPHFETVAGGGRRGVPTRRYRVSMRAATPAAGGDRRGLFSVLNRRVLKVLIFPIADFFLGAIEKSIARHWESNHAPYGLTFDASTFRDPGERRADPGGLASSLRVWRRLVHGTFSTAHGCSSHEAETITELSRRYEDDCSPSTTDDVQSAARERALVDGAAAARLAPGPRRRLS
jgi:hypothetical protein